MEAGKDREEENIVLLCKGCGDRRRVAFQQKLKEEQALAKSFEGKHVKLAFRDGECVEHMWVLVQKAESPDCMFGVLENFPVLVKNVSNGDYVQFGMEDLQDAYTDEEKADASCG